MKDERNPFITLEEARARGLRHSEPEPVACTYCGRATVPLGIEYGGEVRWITHEPCGCPEELEAKRKEEETEAKEAESKLQSKFLKAGIARRFLGAKVDLEASARYLSSFGGNRGAGLYLFHDAEGRYSAWGTPYVANGCEMGLESPLVLIYGHHMSDGTMFAPLAGYSSRLFAEEHAEIILYTPERTLHLEPALVNVINANKKNVRLSFGDQEELDEYMAAEEAESEVVLGGYYSGRQAFAFVTCSYETSNSRTVVYAMEP